MHTFHYNIFLQLYTQHTYKSSYSHYDYDDDDDEVEYFENVV